MVRKKNLVVFLGVLVLAVVFLNFATIYFFSLPFDSVTLTGKAVDTGYVRLYVEGGDKAITIYTPENTTYDNGSYTCATGVLPKCDNYRYILPLNVSANFYVDNDTWKYSLYSLEQEAYVEQNTSFTPNTTIPFVRWGNLLTVFVREEDLDWRNSSVIFTIDVPNSAPIISGFTNDLFVCEGESLNSLEDSFFNVTDLDAEDLSGRDSSDISPSDGLFEVVHVRDYNSTDSLFQIISLPFRKAHLGSYVKNTVVYDTHRNMDSDIVNITVIEINNAPVINNDMGAQTIWVSGEGSTFSHQVLVTDLEDGFSDDGNLTFNFTGDLDVSLNVSTGVMSYIPSEGDQGGDSRTYSLSVCVSDSGLSDVSDNFSICSERGYSAESLSDCDDFSLTITNVNRPPTIDSYSPFYENFTILDTTAVSFDAEVSDEDMIGSYPDIDWYVDGILREENENKSSDDFSYTFGCGVSGYHNVTIITSDGLAEDSYTWNISVTNVECPVVVTGGSGGGGAFGAFCNEQWSCLEWGLCQNAERSFDGGSLSFEDFYSVKDLCAQNKYDDRFCGFQITKCFDLNMCNNTEVRVPIPSESRVCYFTENPNCIDGITNCHDGSCELLVDCGGPCGPCPTCSDDKRNQGEKGVDCGGPCPYACEAESPSNIMSMVLIVLLFLIIILFGYILYKIFNIIRYRFFLVGGKKRIKR